MAGLLAWAADVVGGAGHGNDDDEEGQFPVVVFTPEQQKYAGELERKAASLRRAIQDLRLRIPPQDISKSLPYLHAHSLASNADLALQLNAHSTTRQQAQLREDTLHEENDAYEKAISTCQKKIQEKLQEADLLQSKLKEMDLAEKELRTNVDELKSSLEHSQFFILPHDSEGSARIHADLEPSTKVLQMQLDEKKKELDSMEEIVRSLENKWTQVQQDSIKQPSPAQREKILERQLHCLIEQLTAKQAQAEGLVAEIHNKEIQFEKLNGLHRNLETGGLEVRTRRNRFGKTGPGQGVVYADFGEAHHGPLNAGKLESQQKFVFLRSAFVLYILALHVIVFIKISF